MSLAEKLVSEAYITRARELLLQSGITEIGFAEKLEKRPSEEDTLTAKISSSPLVFVQTPETDTLQPLIVGKFYDSSDDDDFSPEAYEFVREQAVIYNPQTLEINTVYDYRRENENRSYKIAEGVNFFRVTESGNLEAIVL